LATCRSANPNLSRKVDIDELIDECIAPKKAVVTEERLADPASPVKASIGIPKDPTQVIISREAPLCCHSPASTRDDVVTPVSREQNSDQNVPEKHPPLRSQAETVCPSEVKDGCESGFLGLFFPSIFCRPLIHSAF
jgi:hypothetical protein